MPMSKLSICRAHPHKTPNRLNVLVCQKEKRIQRKCPGHVNCLGVPDHQARQRKGPTAIGADEKDKQHNIFHFQLTEENTITAKK